MKDSKGINPGDLLKIPTTLIGRGKDKMWHPFLVLRITRFAGKMAEIFALASDGSTRHIMLSDCTSDGELFKKNFVFLQSPDSEPSQARGLDVTSG